MRILLSATALFLYIQNFGQIITKAKAYQNTFLMSSIKGLTSNNHIYMVGFVNHYDTITGQSDSIEVVRIDLNTGTYTTKKIDVNSAASALWVAIMDSTGNYWVGFNSKRHIWKFNFKDSIYAKDYGQGFNASLIQGSELMYSASLCADGNLVFGASSGQTKISLYNADAADTIRRYGVIDFSQDYVLSVAGNSTYMYAQVGQNKKIYLYAISKEGNVKKKLDSIPPTSRYDLRNRNDGNVYVGTLVGKFRLNDTTMTQVTLSGGTKYSDYNEVGGVGQPKINSSYYDPVASTLSYNTSTGLNNTINVPSENILSNIGYLFTDRADTNKVYYIGDYYGALYMYDRVTDTAIVVGKGLGNVYSHVQMNDSMFAFGGYPSGSVYIWNKNKTWDVAVYDTTTQILSSVSKTSNPRFVCYMKNTPAQFHHVSGLLYDSVRNLLIGSGNVDRVGEGVSIAVHDLTKDSTYGYDYNKVPSSNNYRYITWYGKHALLSTTGNNARVYFYDPIFNTMKDSIVYEGWTTYGRLYPIGSILLGIANNRYYKIDMVKNKQIFYDSIVPNSNTYISFMLPDGMIAVNAWEPPPIDFWRCKYLGDLPFMLNYSGSIGSYYSSYGKTITQTKNIATRQINMKSAKGREDWVKDILNP